MVILIELVLVPFQIWLRKTSDNGKLRVYIKQLQTGKYSVRRRTSWLGLGVRDATPRWLGEGISYLCGDLDYRLSAVVHIVRTHVCVHIFVAACTSLNMFQMENERRDWSFFWMCAAHCFSLVEKCTFMMILPWPCFVSSAVSSSSAEVYYCMDQSGIHSSIHSSILWPEVKFAI